MARFSQTFIDQLLSKVDIIDLINQRVALKKQGNNYVACCPFHAEKTPSFSVNQSKQFFHCFGCGVSGSALSFLMQYDNLSFPEAVESLAETLGVSLPQTSQTQQYDISANEVLQRCARFYQQQLSQHDGVILYAAQRGLDDQIMAQFQLGYAPEKWQSIGEALGKDAALQKVLFDSGMLIKSAQGHYDRFRHRLMFPLHNRRGKVIGFGGRVINKEDQPKYLNSPESPWFHKSNELYGFYQLLQNNRNPPWILVTEGYMDVLSLVQHGVHNVVATMGTALTAEHLTQLFRVTEKVILAFDGDAAGIQATDKALSHLLPLLEDGHQLAFFTVPEGDDPDSLIRNIGAQAFNQKIAEARSLTEYFIHIISRTCDPENPADIPRIFSLARPIIQATKELSAWRIALIAALAKMIGLERHRVEKNLNLKQAKSYETEPLPEQTLNKTKNLQVRQLIQLVLHFPNIATELVKRLPEANHLPGLNILRTLCQQATTTDDISGAALIEHWREDTAVYPHLVNLFNQPCYLTEQQAALEEASGLVLLIEKALNNAELERLKQMVDQKGLYSLSEAEKTRYLELSHKGRRIR